MIYLRLRGRIGNQLFMYATACMIQRIKGNNEKIYIEYVNNSSPEGIIYENSLVNYELENVEFIHDLKLWKSISMLPIRFGWVLVNGLIEGGRNNNTRYRIAKRFQRLYNALGVFHMQDGYVTYPKKLKKNTLVDGYFQSEKFFYPIREEIKEKYRLEKELFSSGYPNLDLIENRNSVCISIKVQHNAGNPMYDVCHESYYKRAIEYIIENVEDPLFFICSDNIEYVKENLIDTTKYDTIAQAYNYPVHLSLAAMARCKHFIIGNTSFGWWAQYLSDNEDKIVIAPAKWYNGMDAWQYDIYMDNWIKIEV